MAISISSSPDPILADFDLAADFCRFLPILRGSGVVVPFPLPPSSPCLGAAWHGGRPSRGRE
eukprot:6633879-Pyramimonas_sp.AAC.1